MSDTKSDFDREMSRLEAEIKRLEVEYNMFFAGRLPRLPWETRARVEQLVKRYDRMNLSNTAQRFRFGTVQARFMSFCELWERNLRAKEDGRGVRGRTAAAPSSASPVESPAPVSEHASAPVDEPVKKRATASNSEPLAPEPPPSLVERPATTKVAPPPPPASAPTPAPRSGLDTTRIRDVGRDSDRVTALYDELTRARRSPGEAPMPFDRFATVVKAQLAKLGGGASEVDFRVAVSHGKVTLMAKKADE
jgi:hypothetical protein